MKKFFETHSRDTIWNGIFAVSLVVFASLFSLGAVNIHVA